MAVNHIDVALAADANYAPYLGVTLVSILENAAPDSFLRFHLMVPDAFPAAIRERLSSLSERYHRHEIHYLEMRDAFRDCRTGIPHISHHTYYRLLLAERLPELERCIYLDCDIVVEGDLAEYFRMPLEGCCVAGVRTYGSAISSPEKLAAVAKRLGIPDYEQYINAGAVIFNLAKIRDEKLMERFIALSEKMHDQDVLNAACYGKIRHLPFRCNVLTPHLFGEENMLRRRFADYSELLEARRNPLIIHYADKVKPWDRPESLWAERWWRYARLSPFYEECLFAAFRRRLAAEHEYQQLRRHPLLHLLHYRLRKLLPWGRDRVPELKRRILILRNGPSV